ncbi:MAG: group III truncated hemoglobin [Flavobacteriaceae bacterium]|nr:group III truncated hemoglobin [Flavobacteriaceae bacterium]
MKNDVTNREDLYLIVSEFYKKLLVNKELKHFFEKFQDKDTLEKHLNVLVDFWDNILFYSGTYQKNAMQPHINLHQKKPFSQIHFETWLQLFNESIDENFEGEQVSLLKNRALSVATVMRIKTINS